MLGSLDYLDQASAQALAEQLRACCGRTARCSASSARRRPHDTRYTKYIIVDEGNLSTAPTRPRAAGRRSSLNRDIIRLFPTLRVSDSFLLQNNLREILFRKPA